MQDIHFSELILEHCPSIRLGCILAQIEVSSSEDLLWVEIEQVIDQIRGKMDKTEIKSLQTIAAARQAYKQFGKDPSRYRPSAEALLRRVLSGKALYKVNNLVDLINSMSIKTGFSIGGYDYEKIQGQIEMSVGQEEDDYQAIGRGSLNIEFLPCLRDEKAAFGSPTSDSTRTSIQPETTKCLWVYFDFDQSPTLEESLEESTQLLKRFAFAQNIKTAIITP